MKIQDISINEYFTMQDTSYYDVFLDVINPKNILCGNSCDLSSITFDEYNVLKGIFNKPTLKDFQEVFIHLYNIKGNFLCSSEKTFLKESVFNFFRSFNYLKNFITEKSRIEKKMLTSEPDYKMTAVNAQERLGYLGHQLTKIKLAEQFGQDPSTIGGWKYSKVFGLLLANNAYSSVMADASKIK